jgi:hypothetical protein
MTAWTKPYYGIQHYGARSLRERWATVCDHGTWASATTWIPGAHSRSPETHHDSVEEARAYAERWVNGA